MTVQNSNDLGQEMLLIHRFAGEPHADRKDFNCYDAYLAVSVFLTRPIPTPWMNTTGLALCDL
ncbi:hypothetical protein PpBr36_03276 [Pyricularia pennisetigena]|uniref:hypothetical protein n=1 Tax=Pyricularia pennisetigena TaxID=1578925 RepID=UPI001150D1E3|nr:hypothetical protein PpBr36_03276 [Pyricularia pennisetigena]TLS30123.1 hypothetical protein PpBr36_03276 [Pyricularia pennisetigena]